MTHEVHSRPLPPAAPTAPAAAARPSAMDRIDGALEWLWHFLSSMRLAMVLMLGIAILAIPGTLLRQMPAATLADAAAKAEWLDSVRPFYGGWTNVWNSVQFFEVFNSVAFRILVATLTISLIACSIHRIPGMVRTARRPRVDVGPAFFEHAPQHEAIVSRRSAAETAEAVQGVLAAHRYRTLTMDDGVVHVYADRYRWLSFAGLFAHLAIVALLAGAIIGGMFGFRDADFAVAEGATRAVAADPGLALQLLDFSDKYDPATGAPIDYASQVILLKNGQEVARQTVRVNNPLRYDGLTFYQAGFGSAAVMTITDKDGKQLANEGIPFTWQLNQDGRSLGIYSIPDTGYTLWIMGTTGADDARIKPGQVEVQVYQTGQDRAIDDKVIDQGKAATVAGMTMTFDREAQHSRFNVARDPGVPLVWGGAIVLFAGFAIRFMFPHKRVWGRIVGRPNGGSVVGMATLTTKDVAQGSDFENLVNDIRAALQAPAKA